LRNALTLARLHRAGELVRVWVSDPAYEAMRDLVRIWADAVEQLRKAGVAWEFLQACTLMTALSG
jgi:transposase